MAPGEATDQPYWPLPAAVEIVGGKVQRMGGGGLGETTRGDEVMAAHHIGSGLMPIYFFFLSLPLLKSKLHTPYNNL